MIKWIMIPFLFLILFILYRYLSVRPGRMAAREQSRVKLDELSKIPVGIKVTIVPEKVRAVRDGRSGSKFTWNYVTQVETIGKEIRIYEFGAFSWKRDHWLFGTVIGRPFRLPEFEEWYDCKDGILRPGEVYTDLNNYSGSDYLTEKKGKWYYLGSDMEGNSFRGEAIVACEAKLEGE